MKHFFNWENNCNSIYIDNSSKDTALRQKKIINKDFSEWKMYKFSSVLN